MSTAPTAGSPVLIEVTPTTFTTIAFDADRIAALAGSVAEVVGLTGVPIRIDVDEESPLTSARLTSVDPIVIAADGGAFEDPARPRRLADDRVNEEVGRLLLRARDRGSAAFAAAPGEDELTIEQHAAWDVAAFGRLERLGIPVHAGRRRYQFLVRHGFTDVAEDAFRRLWDGHDPTWDDVATACAATAAVRG